MPIYRIRKYSGYKGGANYYHHADVIERSRKRALKAAQEGRVRNWRWIDTFDTASKNYIEYEILYTEHPELAKRPERPLPVRLKRLEDKVRELDNVRGIYIWLSNRLGDFNANVVVGTRSPKLRVKIEDILLPKVREIRFRYISATR